jgi:hypothetical protein
MERESNRHSFVGSALLFLLGGRRSISQFGRDGSCCCANVDGDSLEARSRPSSLCLWGKDAYLPSRLYSTSGVVGRVSPSLVYGTEVSGKDIPAFGGTCFDRGVFEKLRGIQAIDTFALFEEKRSWQESVHSAGVRRIPLQEGYDVNCSGLAQIVSIQPVGGEVPVYDVIEVPSHHSFFTGLHDHLPPIVAHNCIDEANFMKTPEGRVAEDTQAYKIYHHATRRMKSRFLKGGANPGFACIVSSRLTESSFLEELMRENKNNPAFYVTDFALWQAKGYENYSPHHFRVAVGNKYRRSEILDEVDTHGSVNTKEWTLKAGESKSVPPGMSIIRIPADFYFDFTANIEGNLRDIAGIATFGAHPLICRTESVWECVDTTRKHPFTVEEATLSLDDPESSLVSITQWKDMCQIVKGSWIPKYHPGSPRIVHVDLGLTGDAAAISMGCSYDVYSKSEFNPTTGQIQEEWCPKVWVDFMLRIVPVRGQQIDLGKIVTYIVNLRNYGFNLQRVTFDGFASEMAIQSILKANLTPPRSSNKQRKSADEVVRVESYVVSVDRDDKPYRMLRDMLFQGAVSYYNYPPFIDEVLALEHDVSKTAGGVIKGKVDHPPKGKKDTADAVCGMVYGIATSKVSVTPGPVRESIGDAPRTDVESQLTADVVRDYGPDVHRIAALIPSPVPTPPPMTARNHKIQTRSWHDEIGSGFGKHRP